MRIHPQVVATLQVIDALRKRGRKETLIICFGERGIERTWVEQQRPLFHVGPKNHLTKKRDNI